MRADGDGVVSDVYDAALHRYPFAAIDVDSVVGPSRAVAPDCDSADEDVLAAVEEEVPVWTVQDIDVCHMNVFTFAEEDHLTRALVVRGVFVGGVGDWV